MGRGVREPFTTANKLFRFLRSTFANRLQKPQAKEDLKRLRFYSRNNFTKYASKFALLYNEAKVPSDQRKELLRESLPANLQKAIYQVINNNNASFNNLVKAAEGPAYLD